MEKILILDGVDQSAINVLKDDFEVDVRNSVEVEELKNIISNYAALIVRSQTKVSADIINSGNLKIIGRAGVGVDNIDVEAASRKGVIVVNSPDGNTIAAAEHTVALLTSLARHIPNANQSLKNGEWKRKEFTGVELYNKTLGVIGFGRIGSHVAKICKAMGMKIMAYDPFINRAKAEELGIEVVEIAKILTEADFITIHVPLTNETKNLINIDTIKKMKKGVRIVNCSRGGIINEDDLVYAIGNKMIGGAALDVFEKEPLTESPLQKVVDNLIITPHLGASTKEAQINVAIDVANQIHSFLNGNGVKNAVNMTGMNVPKDLKPYLTLADKLGSILGQLGEHELNNISIKYQGELSEKTTRPLTLAVVKGILSPALKDTINYINAPLVAKDRGINIEDSHSSEVVDYKSSITVKAKFGNIERIVVGTVLNEEERIVKIDDYTISFKPEGKLLVTTNIDKPGMVGKVGSILGQNNINIASMDLGRNFELKKALMIINVDEAVSDAILTDLKSMEGVLDIKMVVL